MIDVERPASHVGIGLYSYAEAARLIKESPVNVRRWTSTRDTLVPRALAASERTLTFAELMELHFIKMFRDQGVSLPTIRKASQTARQRFRADYPFSIKRFDTDGKTIFATLRDKAPGNTELIEDLEKSQYVFGTIMKPFFRKLDYQGNLGVARYWPCSRRGRVVLDPRRKFGQPIDAATGVPTRVIADALSAGGGQSPDVVARWLGVPLVAVHAAERFERTLRP